MENQVPNVEIAVKAPEAVTPVSSAKPEKSGLATASLVLGLVSFIPIVGFITGLLAIVFGLIGRTKKGIIGMILGILGILFSIGIYGAIFYFGFVAKNGPYTEVKKQLDKEVLTQNAGYLELYFKKNNKYPETLKELANSGYQFYPSDSYLKPLFYKTADNGQTYDLRSLGPDGKYGTADDVVAQTFSPSPSGPAEITPIMEATPMPTTVPTQKPKSTLAPTKAAATTSNFVSSGTITMEPGITGKMLNVTKQGSSYVANFTFANTSTTDKNVETFHIAMYGKTLATYGNPPASFTLSAGQSRNFTLTFEAISDPLPYTWKYAQVSSKADLTMGVLNP